MRQIMLGVVLMMAASTASAQAAPDAAPAIDPRGWRGEVVGERTQVLTIGSAHLSALPAVTQPMLEPLLARLVAFRPDIITYEGVSGEQCAMMEANPTIYPDVASTYCYSSAEIEQVSGQSIPAARAAMAAMLATWPAAPTAVQRRQLASLFFATNERPSALVQWLQLPAEERREGDGVTPALMAILTAASSRMNESYAVAAVVAARLGHHRIYGVDDHSADAINLPAPAGFEAAVNAVWQSPAAAAIHMRLAPLEAELVDGASVLAYYRVMNDPATLRDFIDVDHRAALRGNAQTRRYTAWWETRNLRMVANIRAAFGARPGARVLNIVGASHKPYYDAYLAMMPDVQLVDAEAVLR